jgi:hypothetical protein
MSLSPGVYWLLWARRLKNVLWIFNFEEFLKQEI